MWLYLKAKLEVPIPIEISCQKYRPPSQSKVYKSRRYESYNPKNFFTPESRDRPPSTGYMLVMYTQLHLADDASVFTAAFTLSVAKAYSRILLFVPVVCWRRDSSEEIESGICRKRVSCQPAYTLQQQNLQLCPYCV